NNSTAWRSGNSFVRAPIFSLVLSFGPSGSQIALRIVPIGDFEVAIVEYARVGVFLGERWRSHDRIARHPVGGSGAGIGVRGLKSIEYPDDLRDVSSQR